MLRFMQMGHRRIPALAAPAILVLLSCAVPAHALKLATWNLIDYPTTNPSGRAPSIRTVIGALDPDVIILQELKAAGRDSFLTNVLGVVQPGQWAAGTYINTAESCVFYKPAKVNLTFAGGGIATAGPRDVLGVRLKFPGYVSREAELRLYSVHFKAGTADPGTTDSLTRRLECTDLRNNLNAINTAVVTRHFLIGGDTNFYGDWEGGYRRLVESQPDNDGRSVDPLTMPGTWNANFAYRFYDTQSTCGASCPAPFSAGGMDDRFDLIIGSGSMQDNEGLDIVLGNYVTYGNDGDHFNTSINAGGFNNAVGITVANALFNSSDHVPVMVTIQAPAKISADSQLDFGRLIVGGSAPQTLLVANPAVAPADELTYTLAAPAGFTAPAGTFQAFTGAGANGHTISIDTTAPALRAGTLSVACDDPDSASKPVQLSGTVLAHAVPSLDSLAVVHADTLDFGPHMIGEFTDQTLCVHNQGWTTLQSNYRVANGPITGGGGRFSVVGGVTPIEIAGTSHCYAVHFDDYGAPPADSTYQATLTLSGTDEAVPGQAASPDLVVLLRASVLPTLNAPDRRPERTALLAPAPNPFRADLDLGFDLARAGDVALEVFDLSGRRVAGILEGHRDAGRHAMRWRPMDDTGAPLRAGLYFVRLEAREFVQMRRIILLP